MEDEWKSYENGTYRVSGLLWRNYFVVVVWFWYRPSGCFCFQLPSGVFNEIKNVLDSDPLSVYFDHNCYRCPVFFLIQRKKHQVRSKVYNKYFSILFSRHPYGTLIRECAIIIRSGVLKSSGDGGGLNLNYGVGWGSLDVNFFLT